MLISRETETDKLNTNEETTVKVIKRCSKAPKPPVRKPTARKSTRKKSTKLAKEPLIADADADVEDITPTSLNTLKEWIISQNAILRQ